MTMKPTLLFAAVLLLGGCGYKGDLYLPKEGDDARFGVIQTGLEPLSKEPAAPKSKQP